jgi:5-methylcytosine-specific restriction protein A
MRGRKWMALRLAVLSDEPRCYICGDFAHGDDIVDHVVPLAAGGTDDRSNLHRCCRSCHDQKTSRESTASRPAAGRP